MRFNWQILHLPGPFRQAPRAGSTAPAKQQSEDSARRFGCWEGARVIKPGAAPGCRRRS